jgi:hypothetical protein
MGIMAVAEEEQVVLVLMHLHIVHQILLVA